MKTILIVVDGLSDRPVKRLKGKTPLGAASTPNMDQLAGRGSCGLVEPFYFPWQKYPRSDTAHLAMFGYDPKTNYSGRGVYEALGENVKLGKGDVAFRANFATVDNNLKVVDRRAGRINDTRALIESISGMKIRGVRFLLVKSLGHRAVLVLKGNGLSSNVGGGDNDKHVGVKAKPIVALGKSKKSEFTAAVLNEFLKQTHDVLKNHNVNVSRKKKGLLPANYLLIRGAGEFKKTPSFYSRYKLKAACVAAGHVYRGVARALGMDLIDVKGATGNVNTNLSGKISAAARSLKGYDFVFCHIKGVDLLSENGDCSGKVKFIEKIDKSLSPLLKIKDTRIVVTADHSTCCGAKKHCIALIPVLICNNIISSKAEKKIKFSEKSCRKGKLKKFKQIKLMSKILKQ